MTAVAADRAPDIAAFRRVIVGVGEDGRSRVVSDSASPHFAAASDQVAFAELWLTPSPAPEPGGAFVDIASQAPRGPEPEDPRGTLCRVVRFEPASATGEPAAQMHATKTVDYVYVISGELLCTLENGESTAIRAGDILIQRGTAHAWSNPTEEPCVALFVQVGAPDHGTVG
jgi:quercetin dioxygenase-like cupin family protein